MSLTYNEQSALKIGGCDVPSYSRVRKRKIFADKTREIEGDLDARHILKIMSSIIMDTRIENLAKRKEAYEIVASKFQVLSLLQTCASKSSEVKNAASKLSSLYPEDNSQDFVNECVHFQMYVELEGFQNVSSVLLY